MGTIHTFGKQIGLAMLCLLPAGITAQNNLISNTADCSGSRPPFEFDIHTAWVSDTGNSISTCATPLAGDIDGDGVVEIFAIGTNQSILYILDGRDGSTITTLSVNGYVSGGVTSSIVLCNINGKGAIFNDGRYGMLTLWTVSSPPGVRPISFHEEWSVPGGNTTGDSGTMPIAVDFDGDGIVEFVSRGQIIDSQNGDVLASLPYKAVSIFNCSFHTAMDLDGDGLPEVIAGTEVYKYSRYASPQLQLWRSLSDIPGAPSPRNGISVAADVDQDGTVDLVFVDGSSGTIMLYVWTPSTNTMVGTIATGVSGSSSYPFVGDIDGIVINGKKYPEICINTANRLYAYFYDGTSFLQKWSMSHTDGSAATSLTLFDFDLDGVVELVYRDENFINIYDGSGSMPDVKYQALCGSVTCDETPIIVDISGDGSANIVVTGHATSSSHPGEVMAFEGAVSKWASCPPVWNQQMYSNLLVNSDLTIPDTIKPVNLTFTQTCPDKMGNVVQFYNGGPMQAPCVSDVTYCPIDLSSDVFIVSGSFSILSSTSVSITIMVGNQGLAMAPASTPVRYYANSIVPTNVLAAANTTLGVDLYPGQTTTITQTITGLSPMPAVFFVRLLDDGVNFPALGAFSDCDLTNNTKSFGTLELTKELNLLSHCLNSISVFTVKLKNDGTTTYSDIQLTDSLGAGWDFVSAIPSPGTTVSSYNPVTRSVDWDVPSIAPGDSVVLMVYVKSIAPGSLRNYSWIYSVNSEPVEKEYKSAYVIVSVDPAPAAPSISPSGTVKVCPPATGVTLAVSGPAVSWQWYKDGIAIPGAISDTYFAAEAGDYTATLFDGSCSSEMSDATVVTIGGCLLAVEDYAQTISGVPVTIDVLANDELGDCPSLVPLILSPPDNGSAAVSGNQIIFTPNAGFTGQTDFEYMIVCNGSSSQNKVYVTVLPAPDIVLQDSCSTQPKLQITIQYVGAMYGWYYSAADDGITWDLITGEETVTLLITEGGFYKAKINYNGVILETLPVELVIDRKVLLPGNVWWYQVRKL